MHNNMPQYLRWLSALCALMATFGVSILIVGYKELTFGKGATIVALYAAAAILLYISHRLKIKIERAQASSRGEVSAR